MRDQGFRLVVFWLIPHEWVSSCQESLKMGSSIDEWYLSAWLRVVHIELSLILIYGGKKTYTKIILYFIDKKCLIYIHSNIIRRLYCLGRRYNIRKIASLEVLVRL